MTARLGPAPLTNAQKQARARFRRANKLARYEAALREIAEHPGPNADDACWYRVNTAQDALATPTTQS